MVISNKGVSNEPIRSIILLDSSINKERLKIDYCKINNAKFPLFCAIGVTVISNEVEAVRGIANNGPIVRYMIKKINENRGDILLKTQYNHVYQVRLPQRQEAVIQYP